MMKKFLLYLLRFILPVVIFIYPLDLWLSDFFASRDGMKSTSGDYQVWNAIMDSSIHSEILILGSSRAAINIDNNLLSQASRLTSYNLGYFGGMMSTEYLRYLIYPRAHTSPHLIIFSLDLGTLDQEHSIFHPQTLFPYMLWDARFRLLTERFDNFSIYDYLIPLARYHGSSEYINNLLEDDGEKYDPKKYGYRPIAKEWSGPGDGGEQYIVHLDSVSILQFESLITTALKSGTQVVLVMTPMHTSRHHQISDNAEVLQYYSEVASRYQVPFLNYAESILSEDTMNFFDAAHCTPLGAQRTTHLIIADLKRLGYF